MNGDELGSLSGMPLDEVMEVLGKQGLAVEGAYANGVTTVSAINGEGNITHMPVKPVVVWRAGDEEPTTLYYPARKN